MGRCVWTHLVWKTSPYLLVIDISLTNHHKRCISIVATIIRRRCFKVFHNTKEIKKTTRSQCDVLYCWFFASSRCCGGHRCLSLKISSAFSWSTRWVLSIVKFMMFLAIILWWSCHSIQYISCCETWCPYAIIIITIIIMTTTADVIVLNTSDLTSLQTGEYLNDSVVDFYCKYVVVVVCLFMIITLTCWHLSVSFHSINLSWSWTSSTFLCVTWDFISLQVYSPGSGASKSPKQGELSWVELSCMACLTTRDRQIHLFSMKWGGRVNMNDISCMWLG